MPDIDDGGVSAGGEGYILVDVEWVKRFGL